MEDFHSEFSSIENQVMKNIPEEKNFYDIQDLANFPRDSLSDYTPNNYPNASIPFQSSPTYEFKNMEKDSDSDSFDYESGYSSNFAQTMPKYKQVTGYQNQNLNINMNNSNTYMSPRKYFYNQQNPNSNIISYNNNQPGIEPFPQDTIIEDSQQDYNDDEEEIINENINPNFVQNINDNFKNNVIQYNNNNYNNNLSNKINENIKPNVDKEKLYAKCRKKGTPPRDDDFSLEGWKLFYPTNEKFFLWDKGKTIKNQFIVKNPDDDEKIEIYEGEVNNNNEKHGFGILTTPKYVRIGTWRYDEFTGWCRESRINGDIYEGKFIDGAIFGKGISKTHKGNLYVGDFVESKREGKGELKTKRIHYEGDFKYDKLNGKGKLEYLEQGYSYEGEFKDNQINGMGIFKWNNGDVYEGEMTNGKMNGYGKYTYSNGQVYEGNYVNGNKHGLGKLYYPNNVIYEGEFKNGKPRGEGTMYIDGKKINVIYKDGKFKKK